MDGWGVIYYTKLESNLLVVDWGKVLQLVGYGGGVGGIIYYTKLESNLIVVDRGKLLQLGGWVGWGWG